MHMKSLVFAAGVSLGLASAACSQETDVVADATPASSEASAEASGFNLKLPGDTSNSGYDGFNLSVPAAQGGDVPTLSTNPLGDLPEFGAPPSEPAAPAPSDDDIVRLDPS